MTLFLSDIAAYFQYLCEQHPDLKHQESTGSRVFEVKSYEAALADFRTAGKPKDFFVRFILPTMGFESQNNNARKKYQAGLLVGRWYSRRAGDKDALLQAQTDAERVADDLVARMVADSRNGHPLFNNAADQIENLHLTGDFLEAEGDGSFGAVLYMFDFSTFRGLEAGCLSVVWLDGGLTPFTS